MHIHVVWCTLYRWHAGGGFLDTVPESDTQSDNPSSSEENNSSYVEVGLLDSPDSSVGSGLKQHWRRMDKAGWRAALGALPGSVRWRGFCPSWNRTMTASICTYTRKYPWVVYISALLAFHRVTCATGL